MSVRPTEMTKQNSIKVIGGGLAGCEAAWALANKGFAVELYEMKPKQYSPAHHSENLAELVCSNSLKSNNPSTAGGLLKAEMRLLGSLLLAIAEETTVPAGGALAVDRERFSRLVTNKITSHPNITVVRDEVAEIPEGNVIVATGPLTSNRLAESIRAICGSEHLSFFDAVAPIVAGESIDRSIAFLATRYDKGDPDYINCPMNKEQYETFYQALITAETAPLKEFENLKVYEGCMPVEVLAKRGIDTLCYGPLRPVGLTNPHTGERPHAVVQLRKEDAEGSGYNLVGFQTNLKFGAQQEVFRLIPGLEHAEFYRYGVMHRNTFIDSPRLLNSDFTLRKSPNIIFAGQITGVEGYMESAASGIVAAHSLARRLEGGSSLELPQDTMLGALCRYISNENILDFQPMGANMGLLPPAGVKAKKAERYEIVGNRALVSLEKALSEQDFKKE